MHTYAADVTESPADGTNPWLRKNVAFGRMLCTDVCRGWNEDDEHAFEKGKLYKKNIYIYILLDFVDCRLIKRVSGSIYSWKFVRVTIFLISLFFVYVAGVL